MTITFDIPDGGIQEKALTKFADFMGYPDDCIVAAEIAFSSRLLQFLAEGC